MRIMIVYMFSNWLGFSLRTQRSNKDFALASVLGRTRKDAIRSIDDTARIAATCAWGESSIAEIAINRAPKAMANAKRKSFGSVLNCAHRGAWELGPSVGPEGGPPEPQWATAAAAVGPGAVRGARGAAWD